MEWLHPWALWFTATLAFPLWLHLKQQSKPKTIDYPSLLLLKQGFPQAMQNQRLRDLLQLILRLLLLLCLVLALAQPRWKSLSTWPGKATLVCDNSVTGSLPHPQFGTLLKAQLAEATDLETKYPDGLVRLPILLESGLSQTEERFGSPSLTLRTWLSDSAARHEPECLIIPALTLARSADIAADLKAWLINDHRRRLLIWESNLTALPQIEKAAWERDSTFSLHLGITAHHTPQTPSEGLVQWKSGYAKQFLADDGHWDFALENSPDDEGVFRFKMDAKLNGPWNQFHFSWPKSKGGRIIHIGSSWVSLPSLGIQTSVSTISNSKRVETEHWPVGSSLPNLSGKRTHRTLAVMLAGEGISSENLERLTAFVLDGGGLIISLGSRSDIAAINSRLLTPLNMGRIGNLTTATPPQKIQPQPLAYKQLNLKTESLSSTATVEKYFVQEDIGQAQALWKSGNHTIAVYHRAGAGQVILWNTDIDSLQWTDIGLDPLLPLLHRAFIANLKSNQQPVELASDSIWTWPVTDEKARVLNPHGQEFSRIRRTLAGIQIGPFPETGIYTCLSASDTLKLAVNLASPWTAAPIQWMMEKADLTRWNWKEVEGQVLWTQERPLQVMTEPHRKSWPIWVSAALMLLLLDGLVALVLRPRKPKLAGS